MGDIVDEEKLAIDVAARTVRGWVRQLPDYGLETVVSEIVLWHLDTTRSLRQQIEIARVEEREKAARYLAALDNIWTQGIEGPDSTSGWMMIPLVEWDSIFQGLVEFRARNGSSASPEEQQ